MRTAEEMYNYCMMNGFGHGPNRSWSIKHFEVIEKNLFYDEEVIMCFMGLHNYVSTAKHDNNYAYAITNKRLLMAQKRVIGENFQNVFPDKLIDVSMGVGMMMGVITVETMNGRFNVMVSRKSAQRINSAIHEAIMCLRGGYMATATNNVANNNAVYNNTNNSERSVADEIKKYKELLDMGAITQEEFEGKKSQLLGLK